MNPLPRPVRPSLLLALAVAVSLTACGSADPVARSDSRALPGAETSDAGSPVGDDGTDGVDEPDPVVQPELAACEPGPGKQVDRLEDVTIPAFSVDDHTVPDQTVGDVVVPGFTVPGFALPETRVEAGCIIRYDAPGACLGATEITGVGLPPVRIPGAEIPPVVVDGETLFEGARAEGSSADGSSEDGTREEQTCQDVPAESGDDFIGAVFRSALFRSALFRSALFRSALYRPAICLEVDGSTECGDSVSVPSLSIPSVSVASQSVESASLPSYAVEGAPGTTVFTDGSEQAYVTPAEVLFDFDQATIKPEAAGSLAAIAAKVVEAGPDATVVVEGHTDDQGTDAYNQSLSEQRASAVALWLSSQGGVAATSITTEGYGESAPAGPNGTDEERAKNRRVVITVTTP